MLFETYLEMWWFTVRLCICHCLYSNLPPSVALQNAVGHNNFCIIIKPLPLYGAENYLQGCSITSL